eukprot:scaffold48825_cov32-Tisochrysis_lutea.AAC.3
MPANRVLESRYSYVGRVCIPVVRRCQCVIACSSRGRVGNRREGNGSAGRWTERRSLDCSPASW